MNLLTLTVEAVCVSIPGVRVAKKPVEYATFGAFGLEGDRHAGQSRVHPNGQTVANDRQWSAVSTRDVEAICADLGVSPFTVGAMGENLRLRGMQLADLADGSIISFPSGARLQVSSKNDPCLNAAKELAPVYGDSLRANFVQQALNRRGVLGVVLDQGAVRPGDTVSLSQPETA